MKKYLLMLMLSGALLSGCLPQGNKPEASKPTTDSKRQESSSTKESKTKKTEPVTGSGRFGEFKDGLKPDDKNEKPSGKTMRVGSETQGYIDIPADWIVFQDLNGGDSIQYTDPEKPTFTIVTLDSFEASVFGVNDISTVETIDAANSVASVWQDPSIKESVEFFNTAMTEIAGHEAYEVHARLKTGQIVTAWVFRTEDRGPIYYLALEGDQDSFVDFYPYLETWSVTK